MRPSRARRRTPTQPPDDDELAATVAELTGDRLDRRQRRRLLGRLITALGRSAKAAGATGIGGGRWLTDLVVQTAPHLPIRDLATLQAHHDGLTGEALADALVRSASRVSAGVGAAGGALATAEWAAPPTLLSTPVQLVAETVAIAAVEVKLVAELHQVYGVPATGTPAQRATAYLTAWARRRGVDLARPSAGLATVLGQATRRELRDQLMRRLGRNLITLGPLFTGAVIGAEVNRRATRALGEAIRHDLLRRRVEGRVSIERSEERSEMETGRVSIDRSEERSEMETGRVSIERSEERSEMSDGRVSIERSEERSEMGTDSSDRRVLEAGGQPPGQ